MPQQNSDPSSLSSASIVSSLQPDILDDQTAFIRLVREGISGATLREVVDAVGHKELFIHMLDTTTGNFSRQYRKKRLSSAESESVLDAYRVLLTASQLFGCQKLAQEWMNTPSPALGEQHPWSLCDTFQGRQIVLAALRKIEYGEFV